MCIYCHLDVPKTDKDEWASDPFQLIVKDNKFFGAGTASGKGPLLCWLQLIQSFIQTNTEVPVNLKFIIDAVNYSNNFGLDNLLHTQKSNLFNNIDCVVVNDSNWIGDNRTALIHGCCGMAHFDLYVNKTEESTNDVKSDMENIFKEICNENRIFIDEFYKNVMEITPDEEDLYDSITDFDINELKLPDYMKNWNQRQILMHFWRFPSIYIGPIEEPTEKTIKRHFILKIVPNQILEEIQLLTIKYVEKIVKKLNIKNDVECKPLVECSTRPWYQNYNTHLYNAAKKALIQVCTYNKVFQNCLFIRIIL